MRHHPFSHLRQLRRPVSLGLTLAAGAALVSCAWLPFSPDRQARAPVLEAQGGTDLQARPAAPAAQRLFVQGMAQAYAFNEAESVRAFKAALAQDPDCAMCAWGVAYQLGPNINSPERGDLGEARRYLSYARQRSAGLPARDRELIEALALRYGEDGAKVTATAAGDVCRGGSGDRADPLDVAYAERMRELADRHPADPDVLALYAEAELIATKGDWWDPRTGKPAGRIGEVADRLEAALQRHPGHTGLNHYLIHTVDSVHVARRGVAAADRLGALAPKSPHLLHMPAHIYGLVGRFADATRVNQQALAADAALDAEITGQGFKPVKDWRGHNGHFLWFAALTEGRGDLALQAARDAAKRAKSDHEFAEYRRSLPLLTLLRLQRWDAVLAEPMPSGERGVATVLGEMAHGVALLRTGRLPEARLALARLEPAAARQLAQQTGSGYVAKLFRSVVAAAQAELRAELAWADQHADDALRLQAEAVTAAAEADRSEPPMLAGGSRLNLARMQMQAGQLPQAEASYRQALAELPGSGWALQGLHAVLARQGKAAQAQAVQVQLAQAWPQADAALR